MSPYQQRDRGVVSARKSPGGSRGREPSPSPRVDENEIRKPWGFSLVGLRGGLVTARSRRLKEALSEGMRQAVDLIYPPACGACGCDIIPGRDPVEAVLCPDCAGALEPLGGLVCERCAAPSGSCHGDRLAGETECSTLDADVTSCLDCARLSPKFSRVHSAWQYGGPLLEAIHAFKYEGRVHLGRPLGKLMVSGFRNAPAADLITPVPSHPRRVRRRGFDHAVCLAAEAGRGLGIPVLPSLLRRARDTAPQARLSVGARLENPRGAFEVRGRAARRLAGRRVLLVDDVMTTGATASACAGELLEAGAVVVEVLTLARAA